MQRSVIRLAAFHRVGALSSCMILRTASTNKTPTITAEKFARDFKMQPMQSHPRSTHTYEASTKGAEVGARNEAAHMNYEAFTPRDINGKLAMPHIVNLLSITPLYCFIVCLASVAWGIFYWDMYCRRNYETVLIARPEGLG